MNTSDIQNLARLGEDSSRQFKSDVTHADSLASEMAAFSNSEGGMILIGVSDDGTLTGLNRTDVSRINQLISNAASQHVRSPLNVSTENVEAGEGKLVIVVTVPKGMDKPYFDKNGVIWLKCGADKRRVNSKEELRRLFQLTAQFHADELPTKAGVDKLDKLRFRDFLRDYHKMDYPESLDERVTLLQNLNLAADNGMLNLAGVLLFAEQPELITPQFVVKAIRYPGNTIHVSDYVDTEDFAGPLQKIFDGAMAFVMRNLHKIQAGRGVNAPGLPEIPEAVFEELIVNALVHRDYLVSAPIRIFIFDNRIEIISPGHLPNNLTVEKVRAGNTNIRNPILVSYVAKGLLPYHGLGSGIKRALSEWTRIEFTDNREGCLFTTTVLRSEIDPALLFDESSEKNSDKSSKKSSEKSSGKVESKILSLLSENPDMTIAMLAQALNMSSRAVEKHMAGLKQSGKLERIGSRKDGYWNVLRSEIDPALLLDERSEKSSEKSSEKNSGISSEKNSGKVESTILSLLSENPDMTIAMLAQTLNKSSRAVEKHIAGLKQSGKLERMGSRKDGYWKVLGP